METKHSRETCEQLERRVEQLKLLADAGPVLSGSLDALEITHRFARLVVTGFVDGCLVDLIRDETPSHAVVFAHADPDREGRVQSWIERESTALDAIEPGTLPADLLRLLGDPCSRNVRLTLGEHRLGTMTLLRRCEQPFDPSDEFVALDLGERLARALDNARRYESAQQALRLREESVGGLLHDLRVPLGSIVLHTGALLAAIPNLERRKRGRRQLAMIQRSAQHLNRLIGNLLDLPRIEAGRLSIDLRIERLDIIVNEAIDVLEPLASERRIGLRVLVGEDLDVLCDRERVLRVLWNLVGNAVKFTPPGGRVELTAQSRAQIVEIVVRDTGPGIAPERLSRLWSPSTHLGVARRGRGLFICRGIIEAHGGQLEVKSAPGQGCTFSFTLPRPPRAAS